MDETIETRSRWQRWVLPTAAVLGAGPWGALTGAAMVWFVGDTAGVRFSDPGLFNFRFWPAMWLLAGFVAGFAVAARVGLRIVQRSPRVLGGLLVAWTALSWGPTLFDPNSWDWLYLWLPGLIPAAALVRLRVRRTAT